MSPCKFGGRAGVPSTFPRTKFAPSIAPRRVLAPPHLRGQRPPIAPPINCPHCEMQEESEKTETTTKTRSDESRSFGFWRLRRMLHRDDKEYQEFWNKIDSYFLTCSACTLISMMIAICAFGFWMLISATLKPHTEGLTFYMENSDTIATRSTKKS